MEKYILLTLITILAGCKSVPRVDVSFKEKDPNISVSDILNPNRQIDILYDETAGKESRAAADSFRLCTEIFAEMPLNIKVINNDDEISEETDFLFSVEITQSEIRYETHRNTTREEVEVDGKQKVEVITTREHNTTKVLELSLLARNQKVGTTLFRTSDVVISTLTNEDNSSYNESDSFGEMLLSSIFEGFFDSITQGNKSTQNRPYPDPPTEHEMLKDYFLSLWNELD